jgi:streptomycin 6-kinase
LTFEQRIRGVFGARGEAWLRALPETIAQIAARWSLVMDAPFANLTYNYVAPGARSDGTPVVLKLGVPNPELMSEVAALRVYSGRGMVALLEADAAAGALLLARVSPGASLVTEHNDDRATLVAAEVMRKLRCRPPAEHAFPTVARWGQAFARLRSRFDGGSGPLPAPVFSRAEALYAELLSSSSSDVVLHGDLHHDNILAAGDAGWLAIDPKGVIGDPAFEPASLLLNPPGLENRASLDRLLARRIDILSEALGLEAERLRGWAEAKAVLSACWTIEDHGDAWQPAIALAERFAALRL